MTALEDARARRDAADKTLDDARTAEQRAATLCEGLTLEVEKHKKLQTAASSSIAEKVAAWIAEGMQGARPSTAGAEKTSDLIAAEAAERVGLEAFTQLIETRKAAEEALGDAQRAVHQEALAEYRGEMKALANEYLAAREVIRRTDAQLRARAQSILFIDGTRIHISLPPDVAFIFKQPVLLEMSHMGHVQVQASADALKLLREKIYPPEPQAIAAE